MKIITKHSVRIAGTLAIAGFALSPAIASEIPIAATAYNSTNPNVTFTGGTLTIGGGAFSTIIGKAGQGTDGKVVVNFSPMTGSSAVASSGPFALNYGPGTFTVTDPTLTDSLLLGGSYTGSQFTGTIGGKKGFVEIDNVTYTPSSTFLNYPTPTTSPFLTTNGSLSVEFGTFAPFTVTGGNLSPFTANDGITYFGTASGNPIPNGGPSPVPEPATLAVFGMGALAIVALAKRKMMTSVTAHTA